ncbi:BQ5605_C018g08624 [Microbotryum silenes-dioicae]|uniref:BQ5605_C018g08624 protein n=1 Tax=Microbotryum silenes-dioicae TaxID=796604 RepID=A0A2X0MRG9_9BASI|nr:BQ5605_C018g08624 [Microbotryum silenes-dioicae]
MEIGGASITVVFLSVGSTMKTIRVDRILEVGFGGEEHPEGHDNAQDDSSEIWVGSEIRVGSEMGRSTSFKPI